MYNTCIQTHTYECIKVKTFQHNCIVIQKQRYGATIFSTLHSYTLGYLFTVSIVFLTPYALHHGSSKFKTYTTTGTPTVIYWFVAVIKNQM
jgi:hypothetical protein